MLDTLKHDATRVAVGQVIDQILKSYYKKDRQEFSESLLKLESIAHKLFKGMYREEVFEGAKDLIAHPDAKWMKFVYDGLDRINPNIVKTLVLNLGYEAALYGNGKLWANREKHGCPMPWTILMDPTSACNLKCKGCWAAEYGYRLNLEYDVMSKIVREGRELGTYFYMFTGGEPTVRMDDIFKLAEEYNDCAFNIFTNGTLITEEVCKRVQELGNIVFSVSIEGGEEANDGRRGEGVYDRVMHAFDLMKEYGLVYGTSVCYTSQNYKSVTSDEFLDKLIEKGCLFSWYFHYMPIGKGAVPELLLTPEQREYMHDRLREIRALQGGKPIFTIDFQNDGEYTGGCIAGGRRYFHINANGDVEPCVFIHYSNVNIHDVSLLDALKSPIFMEFQENQPFNGNHLKPCPMLENPEKIVEMVEKTGAKSTNYEEPESAESLSAKCMPYAQNWSATAEEIWAHSRNNPKNKENKEEKMAN